MHQKLAGDTVAVTSMYFTYLQYQEQEEKSFMICYFDLKHLSLAAILLTLLVNIGVVFTFESAFTL